MNTSKPSRCRWLLFAVLALQTISAWGQWSTQTLSLQPGWNAVYLEVQPQPSDCDRVLTGLGVEKVWGWNRKFSSVQYIQSATSLQPLQPDWLFYVPDTNPLAPQKNLFHLEGGKCYLIKLPDNAPPTKWRILGQPTLRPIDWFPNSFNLVGFSLDLTNPPTFASFFAPSTAHANNIVYRLSSGGDWAPVTNRATAAMRSGEAFWIKCTGASGYQGPLALTIPQRAGLAYGQNAVQQELSIQNLSPSPKTLILTLLPSANPPPDSVSPLAGPVPLSYWKLDLPRRIAAWLPLTNSIITSSLSPGQTTQFKWGVRRPDMIPNAAGPDAVYQSLLEIRDAGGSMRLVVPVTSLGLRSDSTRSSLVQEPGSTGETRRPRGPSSSTYAGLWIGTATINQVNQPASLTCQNTPTNTAAPFQFRLIIHADTANNVNLLQQVFELWQTSSSNTDSRVLLTDLSQTNQVTGVVLRDRQLVGRRISTAAFAFHGPLPMTAGSNGLSFGVSNSTFTCTVPISADDSLNPFMHRYHPDHATGFPITRQITLQFSAPDPEHPAVPGWADNEIGGTYSETITGLQWQTILIAGTFRLSRASDVATLNGNATKSITRKPISKGRNDQS